MVAIEWGESFRIIFSRYPFIGIYDRIADPEDIEAVIELERLTNDRVREEPGDISLVAPADRVAGPGSTPIMAAFTHARPSRFSDGSFGVYYAARVMATAIAEAVFHVELLYRSTSEQSADIDMSVYAARINGMFDDLRSLALTDPRSILTLTRHRKYTRERCERGTIAMAYSITASAIRNIVIASPAFVLETLGHLIRIVT